MKSGGVECPITTCRSFLPPIACRHRIRISSSAIPCRGVRFLLEFAKADERLRSCGVRTTIVVLGSARIREANGDARGAPAAGMTRWYDEARRFGRIVSERGGALAPVDGQRDNVIATGGGPGIMEAANRGACDVGAPSIGFNIQWI